MTERKVYDVSAERVNGWWILRVPAVDTVTQAKRLDQVEFMARDLIYAMTDEVPHSFDVAIKPDLGPSLGATLRKAVKARKDAASAQDEAMTESKRAAVELHRAGLTIRDVGELLGVSYQRVSQLLAEGE